MAPQKKLPVSPDTRLSSAISVLYRRYELVFTQKYATAVCPVHGCKLVAGAQIAYRVARDATQLMESGDPPVAYTLATAMPQHEPLPSSSRSTRGRPRRFPRPSTSTRPGWACDRTASVLRLLLLAAVIIMGVHGAAATCLARSEQEEVHVGTVAPGGACDAVCPAGAACSACSGGAAGGTGAFYFDGDGDYLELARHAVARFLCTRC